MKSIIQLTVNGEPVEAAVDPNQDPLAILEGRSRPHWSKARAAGLVIAAPAP